MKSLSPKRNKKRKGVAPRGAPRPPEAVSKKLPAQGSKRDKKAGGGL